MVWRRNKKRSVIELHPDEILLDVHNLPAFNTQQFEGRIELPIRKRTLIALFSFMAFISLCFVARLAVLQIAHHKEYLVKSEQNSLDHIPVFADRGVVYDRTGTELAWNSTDPLAEGSVRDYIQLPGFATLLGYVSYPAKDEKGKYWQFETVGKDGVEKELNGTLAGNNGTKLIETDVSGHVLSESTIEEPKQGTNVSLAINADMQAALASGMHALAEQSGYTGGAGAIMDINTGELFALTSFPEYKQSVLALGQDREKIREYIQSKERPFLNRVTEGLYTPGSIVKPFMALAALQEGIIDPNKVLHTTGELRVPNPYNPGQFTIFRDNADHGDVDMKKAIEVSSNVYFYEIGGGFGTQPGLGISNIEKYTRMFGIGEKTGINIEGELTGVVPSVAWKAKRFPGDAWRIGDTYNTSIGQYGFQVTPIQMLRAVASVASRGNLVTPTILKKTDNAPVPITKLPFNDTQYSVIHAAMRGVVTDGTGRALNSDIVRVAAKTGTAQIRNNTRVNSWAIGFFPIEKPRFAFVVLMENGPKVSVGATHAFRPVLDLFIARPELLTD
jgi:penicillin-binding protein 2